MNVLVVEHEARCPPALMGRWLEAAGCRLTVCRPWAGEEVPPLDGYDGWLVLGGSMNAYDDDRAPWLPQVRDRIREAADTGVPVLGICLGHQLAAVATGGRVEKNPAGQRVGLHVIGWTEASGHDDLTCGLGSSRRAVQWNDDIVVATGSGAVVLARRSTDGPEDGEIQAVRFAPTVWGVQWHPEVDRTVVGSWAEGDRDEHLAKGIDQEALLDAIEAAGDELEAAWRPLATAFARVVRDRQ